jgi:hypothetical protein
VVNVPPGDAAKVQVSIDGVEVPQEDRPMLGIGYAVKPGEKHTLLVRVAGYDPWSDSVTGTAGLELPPLIANPKRLPEPAAPVGAQPTILPQSSPLRTVGWVTAGVGAAGLALGTVFGVVAIGKRNDYNAAVGDPANQCGPNRQTCNQTVKDARNAIDGPATISTVALVAGGVLTAGGLALVLFAPSGKKAEPSSARRRGLQLGAGVGLGSAFVTGSFE